MVEAKANEHVAADPRGVVTEVLADSFPPSPYLTVSLPTGPLAPPQPSSFPLRQQESSGDFREGDGDMNGTKEERQGRLWLRRKKVRGTVQTLREEL